MGRIVDVAGWAPTADGLSLVNNFCTNSRFSGFTVITPATSGNDAAMQMLRDGSAAGMFGHAYNGTTLAISKKGSGLNEILNPCLERYMQTQHYYEVCANHSSLLSSCYPNSYFPPSPPSPPSPWMLSTNLQTGDCSTGYCSCNVALSTEAASG